jgi:hypothetical protein
VGFIVWVYISSSPLSILVSFPFPSLPIGLPQTMPLSHLCPNIIIVITIIIIIMNHHFSSKFQKLAKNRWFFLAILEFELRALCLLGLSCTTWVLIFAFLSLAYLTQHEIYIYILMCIYPHLQFHTVPENDIISFFSLSNISWYQYIPYFPYSHIRCWKLQPIPQFSNHEQSCN